MRGALRALPERIARCVGFLQVATGKDSSVALGSQRLGGFEAHACKRFTEGLAAVAYRRQSSHSIQVDSMSVAKGRHALALKSTFLVELLIVRADSTGSLCTARLFMPSFNECRRTATGKQYSSSTCIGACDERSLHRDSRLATSARFGLQDFRLREPRHGSCDCYNAECLPPGLLCNKNHNNLPSQTFSNACDLSMRAFDWPMSWHA